MGQIVSLAAKPKRCNLNQLSQVPTPAAGEHILVSSDNSMNAAGQGNFDCYIVGDGTTAATALSLHSLADNVINDFSTNSIQNKAVKSNFNEIVEALGGGGLSKIPITWESGTYYKSDGTKGSGSAYSSAVVPVTNYRGKKISLNLFSTGAQIYIFQKDANNTTLYSLLIDSNTIYPLVITIDTNATSLLLSNKSSLGVGSANVQDFAISTIPTKTDINSLMVSKEMDVNWADGYWDVNGVKQSNSNFSYATIDVSTLNRRVTHLQLFSSVGATIYCLIKNADGNILWKKHLNAVNNDFEVEIPPSSSTLLLSNRKAGGTPHVYISTPQNTLSQLDNASRKAIAGAEAASLLGIFSEWIKGEYYTIDLGTGSNASYERTQIDVSNFVGLEYKINTALQANGTAYTIFADANNSVLESYRNTSALTGTIPSNAKYIYISNHFTGTSPTVAYPSVYIFHAYDLPLLGEQISTSLYSTLQGKKVSFLGDSITQGTGAGAGTKYVDVFSSYTGCIVNNLGVEGTTIADGGTGYSQNRFVSRATSENLSDSDMVVVFGGTNDFSKDVKDIGELFAETSITPTTYRGSKELVAPSDVDAFGGALHNLINTIRTNAPNVPIIFITPIPKGVYTYNTDSPSSHQSNRFGKYLSDFVDAIIRVCAFYSIPVLNLYSISQLDFTNATIAANYSADNLHPNVKGHRIIADLLYSFVKENVIELVK